MHIALGSLSACTPIAPFRFVAALQAAASAEEFLATIKRWADRVKMGVIINNSDKSVVAKSESNSSTFTVPPGSWYDLQFTPFDGVASWNPGQGKVMKCPDYNIAYIDSNGQVSCYPSGVTPLDDPPDEGWEPLFAASSVLQAPEVPPGAQSPTEPQVPTPATVSPPTPRETRLDHEYGGGGRTRSGDFGISDGIERTA